MNIILYDTFVVFGGVGMGKTHFLREFKKDISPQYCSIQVISDYPILRQLITEDGKNNGGFGHGHQLTNGEYLGAKIIRNSANEVIHSEITGHSWEECEDHEDFVVFDQNIIKEMCYRLGKEVNKLPLFDHDGERVIKIIELAEGRNLLEPEHPAGKLRMDIAVLLDYIASNPEANFLSRVNSGFNIYSPDAELLNTRRGMFKEYNPKFLYSTHKDDDVIKIFAGYDGYEAGLNNVSLEYRGEQQKAKSFFENIVFIYNDGTEESFRNYLLNKVYGQALLTFTEYFHQMRESHRLASNEEVIASITRSLVDKLTPYQIDEEFFRHRNNGQSVVIQSGENKLLYGKPSEYNAQWLETLGMRPQGYSDYEMRGRRK